MEKSLCAVEESRGNTVGSHPHINPYKSSSFDDQIRSVFEDRGSSPYTWLVLSTIPPILSGLGLCGERITVSRSSVIRHRTKTGHLACSNDWIRLANNLHRPIAYGDIDSNKLWLYHEFEKGKSVKVIIEKEVKGIKAHANSIITAFIRDKDLDYDIATGKAKKINQSSVQQTQLLADLPASTGSI